MTKTDTTHKLPFSPSEFMQALPLYVLSNKDKTFALNKQGALLSI